MSEPDKDEPDFIHFPVFAPLWLGEERLSIQEPVIQAAIKRLNDRNYHRFFAIESGYTLMRFHKQHMLSHQEMQMVLILVRNHLIGFNTFATCANAIAKQTKVSAKDAGKMLIEIRQQPIEERDRNHPQTSQFDTQAYTHMLRFWYGVRPRI